MAKLSKASVTKALREYRGNILKASEALGVGRPALYHFINANPEMEQIRIEARETLLDVAENHLNTAIENGDHKMIRYYLDRQGKDRGYTTRQETTGAGGGPLEFETIERQVVDHDKPSEE